MGLLPTSIAGRAAGELVVGYQPYYTQAWSAVVMRGKKFYEKYLPKGSNVEFQIGLQGAIIVNNMLAGKQHIGYYGDMPGIVSTTKPRWRHPAGRRARPRVGPVQRLPRAQRRAAVQERPEAIKWLTARPSRCRRKLHRPLRAGHLQEVEHPAEGVPEPEHRGDHVQLPRRQARRGGDVGADHFAPGRGRPRAPHRSGESVQENDGGLLGMRADLIKQRPDVVKAWLQAELDAQLFIADPKNAPRSSRWRRSRPPASASACCGTSLYGRHPDAAGAARCATHALHVHARSARS